MATITIADVECEIVSAGCFGQAEVIPLQERSHQAEAVRLPRHSLPCGLPPVLSDLNEELLEILLKPEDLKIHSLGRAQRFVRHPAHLERLCSCDVLPVQSTINVLRNHTTGELISYEEEYLVCSSQDGVNLLFMTRPLGPPTDDVRNGSKNFPFWPGGMDFVELGDMPTGSISAGADPIAGDLETVPPGFKSGMPFRRKESSSDSGFEDGSFSLDELVIKPTEESESDDDSLTEQSPEQQPLSSEKDSLQPSSDVSVVGAADDVDSLLQEARVLKISDTKSTAPAVVMEWAVMVDVNKPVPNFNQLVPDMAYKWPFELDIFQKQAILHLENHESVFVAAHTSAGKTVVAEYAIALSKKHMMRTIYTSPIKALSNQKFRDFKTTFEDVGLITGDIQLNQNASCLIMTTEILRSMLYGGSDIIRDLEWVVFDEVHYINDPERGVVWEEVLIMLPAHVSIILLSATTPNTMEFAEWVGRTKKRKVYVISTPKRPVPLEHFLYTGSSGKSSADAKSGNDMFLLVDADKNFLTQNYNKAVLAKKNVDQKDPKAPSKLHQQHYAPKGARDAYGAQQEKNIWLSVIDMLKKKDQLPAVAFTFSKKRIDENCYSLNSVDLTTSSEKSAIHVFFQKCLNRLKPPDRELPQVMFMQGLLKRGLALHHSGVLPILKEIVELLFQQGLIKILFATETFAMGVNMPARTVVFDSLRKHDGVNFRDLLPSEYIQMAGRAGRRGLDSTGTVIILCKAEVPEMSDLHKMLMGKPTQLESKFRLTYSMILNLLRAEHLRIQDMLRRSFGEFTTQKETPKHEKSLTSLKQQLAQLRLPDCFFCKPEILRNYCLLCQEYGSLRVELQKSLVGHPQYVKALSCGRVVVLEATVSGCPRRTVGVTLASAAPTKGDRTYSCLILSDGHMSDKDWKEALLGCPPTTAAAEVHDRTAAAFSPVRSLLPTDLAWLTSSSLTSASPAAAGGKAVRLGGAAFPAVAVVEGLDPSSFAFVLQRVLRISGDQVLEDFRRRQSPRFRDEPASQQFTAAAQDLRRLLDTMCSQGAPSLAELDVVRDLGVHDLSVVDRYTQLQSLRTSLSSAECLDCPCLDAHFDVARQQIALEAELSRVQYLLSEESLRLLPEYEQRVAVLRRLEYLDTSGTVLLKGRVAGCINQHEVPITELLFHNVLSELHHTEIAALLSCFVFEQKNCPVPDLVPSLAKGVKRIKEVVSNIGHIQKECGLQIAVEDYVDELHFGLVEVVFEWARGLPFSQITELTEVQEGLIVRCIQRLDETLRDVKTAAHVIGDPVLVQKMEEASKAIKRDIVFAASLYTQ